MHESEKWKWSRSVVSDSSRPFGLQPTRLLHPWDFPGKSTRVGCFLQKKTEHWRIDAFELWCWKRHLRVPWTARRSNQSILKEIDPEYSLKCLVLKLQYFGHLMIRADSLEKTWCWERLRVRGEGGDRGWDGWMASLTQWTWFWANSRKKWRTGMPGMLQSVESQRVRHDLTTEQQQQWYLNKIIKKIF